jgi:hypothetical protein
LTLQDLLAHHYFLDLPSPKYHAFRSHLVSYFVIIGFLFAINLFTSAGPGYLWAVWPVLGWGLGLVFHGLEAYGIIADKDTEKEMIEDEVRRLEQEETSDFLEDDDRLDLPEIEKELRYNEDDLV